jgi:hypothetical protein
VGTPLIGANMTIEEEWAKEFPDRPFPKAGKITEEVLTWADSIINNGKFSINQTRAFLYNP